RLPGSVLSFRLCDRIRRLFGHRRARLRQAHHGGAMEVSELESVLVNARLDHRTFPTVLKPAGTPGAAVGRREDHGGPPLGTFRAALKSRWSGTSSKVEVFAGRSAMRSPRTCCQAVTSMSPSRC